jgi:hypothetical protein
MSDERRRARLAPSAAKAKASAEADAWKSFPSEVGSLDSAGDDDLGLDSFAEEASLSVGPPARTVAVQPNNVDRAHDVERGQVQTVRRVVATPPIALQRSATVAAAIAVVLVAGLGYLLISGPGSMVIPTEIPSESGPFIAASPHRIAQVPPSLSARGPAPAPVPRLSDPGVNLTRVDVQRLPRIQTESVAVAPSLPSPPAPPTPPTPIARSAMVEPVAPEPPPALARVDNPDPPLDRASMRESALERDEGEIRILLEAYRQSYLHLDAVSTAKIWPGVDTAALARAFGTVSSQQLDFEKCAFDVSGQRAKALCQGSLHYVRRVGNATPQSRETSWAFELDRSSGRWLIDRVTTQ